MKLSLCFLTLLLTFASCEITFAPQKLFLRPPSLLTTSPHHDLAQFYEGLFGHFGLDKPYQIIYECVGNFSSAVFLETMHTFNQLLVDMNARDTKHVHQDFIKQWILGILGHGAKDCVMATQDYSDLVKALGIKRDPLLDEIGQWLYFQANFQTLLEDYKPVIKNLDAKNFSAAGDAYGDVLNQIVQTVKGKGFYYLGEIGLANGFSLGLDVDLPNDTLSIWNDTTAAYDLEFRLGLAKAVAGGKWWESEKNLIKFWEEKGKDIFAKIPVSVLEALQASEDNKKMTERLGIDVWSKEFLEKADAWRRKNQWKYHGLMKDYLKSLEHLDMIHVGVLQATMVREVIRS